MSHWLSFIHTPDFSEFIRHYGYLGIFVWFISFDQLTPIPEELTLLLLGYLSAEGFFNPFLAGVVSLAGFLAIDTAYFFLARSHKFFSKKAKKPSALRIAVEKAMHENMAKAIFFTAFIPRMRLWVPVIFGASKVPYKKFMFYNTAGLVVVTTLYIFLGYFFNQSISALFAKVKFLQALIFTIFLIIVAIVLFVFVWKKVKNNE